MQKYSKKIPIYCVFSGSIHVIWEVDTRAICGLYVSIKKKAKKRKKNVSRVFLEFVL